VVVVVVVVALVALVIVVVEVVAIIKNKCMNEAYQSVQNACTVLEY
jgi:hypothetical protein